MLEDWCKNNPMFLTNISEPEIINSNHGFRFKEKMFEILKHIEKFPGVSSKEIAKEFNANYYTIKLNLLLLYRKNILRRKRVWKETGGWEYAYFIMNNLND